QRAGRVLLVQFRPQALAQQVDGLQLALDLVAPELPAIAGGGTLNNGAHAVDGAPAIGGDESSVGAHLGGPAPVEAREQRAGGEIAALDQPAEGNARLVALARGGHGLGVPPNRGGGGGV